MTKRNPAPAVECTDSGEARWGSDGADVRAIAVNLVRMLATGAVCGLAGVFVIYGAWRFVTPYAEQWETRGEVIKLERRVKQLTDEQRRLQQQARLLTTPEGIKIEARRLGLLKPGERSLRFMTRPEPRAMPVEPERPRNRTKAVSQAPQGRRAPDARTPAQPDD
jgi:cell division protein FtsB